MTVSVLFRPPRFLRLAGWIAAGLFAALALFALVDGLSGLWSRLPWSAERRLDRAEAQLNRAEADLAARRAEVAALERQAAQTDAAHRTLTDARAVTARAVALSETVPDAQTEIDPVRADRLRDTDRRLCALQPDLCPAPEDRPAAPRP